MLEDRSFLPDFAEGVVRTEGVPNDLIDAHGELRRKQCLLKGRVFACDLPSLMDSVEVIIERIWGHPLDDLCLVVCDRIP